MGSSNKRNVTAEMVGFSRCWETLLGLLVANLHGCPLGIVVSSRVLSPDFDLDSSTVRNVLRGWITHGDIAAAWMTQPLALSKVASLLEAFQQAAIAGVYADFHSDTARHLHAASKNFAVRQVPVDLCAFGFIFQKRLTLYSVSVPLYLKLAQRCDNLDHVCSFFGQAHQNWKRPFLHRAHRVRYASFVARGLNHGQWHRWGGSGMQCAVFRAESCLTSGIVS